MGEQTLGKGKNSTLHLALQKHADIAEKRFTSHHPHATALFTRTGVPLNNIRNSAAKLVASGTLATSLFLSTPFLNHGAHGVAQHLASLSQEAREEQFSQELQRILPEYVHTLTEEQESSINTIIREYWGIDAKARYQGEKLNHSYGWMGAEQHLPRYPGDVLGVDDQFKESGITPGRGAWGYFAGSKQELTQEDIEREKYYVAVQTLYLPDWNTDTVRLKNWYKYRKVLVVNPKNGKTIVCDIADAGPAQFTGKQFGGSPEVMEYLDLHKGMKKGAVVLFFIDDSSTTVPLGPVHYNVLTGATEEKG